MAKKYISMREKSRTPIQKRRLSYPPFGQVTDEFLMVQKGRGNRPATLKHYEGTIRKLKKFLVWEYMPDEFETMEEDDILINGGTITCDVLNERRFEGRLRDFLLDIECVSEVTVSTYFRDYRAIAYWLMDEGVIASRQISFKNEEGDIKNCYTDKEISRLLKKPERNCSFTEYRSWVVVHWLLGTGNRISTVCNIKIDDIDFTNSMIDINVQKSRRKHRIPLDSKLRTVLQEYIKEWLTDDQGEYVSPYLFPTLDENFTIVCNGTNVYNRINNNSTYDLVKVALYADAEHTASIGRMEYIKPDDASETQYAQFVLYDPSALSVDPTAAVTLGITYKRYNEIEQPFLAVKGES